MALCMRCRVREAKAGGNYCGACPRPGGKRKVGVSGTLFKLQMKPVKKAAPAKKAAAKKLAANRATSKRSR